MIQNKKHECNRLKFKYRCQKTCKELNELIRSTADMIKYENNRYSAPSQFGEYRNLILSHLYEKTNLKSQLNNMNVSELALGTLFEILYDIKKFDEYELTDKLLEQIDLKLNTIQCSTEKTYKFIFLLNIKRFRSVDEIDNLTNKSERDIFENVIEIFEFKRINIENYDFEKLYEDQSNLTKIMNIFKNSYGEIIEISVQGRDYEFASQTANSKLNLFLGFLSLMRYSFIKRIDNSNEEKSIDNIKAQYAIVLEGKELIYPPTRYMPEEILKSIKNEVSELRFISAIDLNIRNKSSIFDHYVTIIKNVKNEKTKKKLWGCLEEFIRLYYDACTEKNLPYSFLKFWMIGEIIIKKISGKIKDDNLLRRLEKILTMFYKDKFIENRIEFLYHRRNELVHRGNFELITQEDRNLSKIIADSVLIFFMGYLIDLNNLDEYNFLIQNIKKNDNEINRYSKVLEIIRTDRQSLKS